MAFLSRHPILRRVVLGVAVASVPFAVLGLLKPSFVPVALRSVNAMVRVGLITTAVGVWSVILSRFRLRRVIDWGLIALPVIPLAAFVLLPQLYNDREANRTLADAIAAEVPVDATPAVVEGPSTTPSTTLPTSTTATVPPQPVLLSSGTLRGIGHDATGTASIYRLPGGSVVIQFEEIDIEPGPDYDLYLVPGLDQESPDGGLHLGDLKANRGNDFYPLPAGTATDGELTVLIWCESFAVPIAAASQTPA